MIRNLKALGLALAAVLAIGVVAVPGALAAVEHEFHSDGEKVNITGKNLTTHEFVVGAAGVVKCNTVTAEGTNTYALISSGTYKADQLTLSTHYSGCTFAGAAATVNTEHCAFVYDSDTTPGNPTGGEHANVEIECSEGNSIKITTSVCTLTIGPQLIKHAVTYESDPENTNAIIVKWTGHSIVTGNLNDKAGCALVPKGAVGKHTGNTTLTCYSDNNEPVTGTTRTTPTEHLQHLFETRCEIA